MPTSLEASIVLEILGTDWESFRALTDAEIAEMNLSSPEIDALGLAANADGIGLLRDADGLLLSWRGEDAFDGEFSPEPALAAAKSNGHANGHASGSALLVALKARGGRRRRGGKDADRVPPNVSRAARRVAKGEGTSEDQKLLRAWEKRKKGGPVEAYLGRSERRELAAHRQRLRSVQSDWDARVAKAATRKRTLTDEDREEFVFNRADNAYDAARSAHYQAREARAIGRGAGLDAAMEGRLTRLSRRDAIRFVARNLPAGIRAEARPGHMIPSDSIIRDIYRERGGTFVGGRGPDYDRPLDPERYAAAEAEVAAMWREALARPRRGGTKALDDDAPPAIADPAGPLPAAEEGR